MEELLIKRELYLDADIHKVWDALVNPVLTKQYYFGLEVSSDWKVGSPILWKGHSKGQEKVYIKGTILDIEVPRLLKISRFNIDTDHKDSPENYILTTYELIAKFGKTMLSIVEGDYANIEDGLKRYAEAASAWDYMLNGLKEIVEGNKSKKKGDDSPPNEWLDTLNL